ncbi:MAG: SRPBCC domain-containing protein [Chloroherpetonaceae bacterium]|nr:SRPBCC domain-containing protein [Chloroherpetonaceae bacterium]
MEDKQNHVYTEIEINASPDKVWSVLTDWDKLKEWSSSFIGISVKKMIKGEKFVSYFKNPLTGGIMELEHICTDYEEGRKFGWSGDILSNTQDHHIYSLVPTNYGTTIFEQEDGLHGPHSRLLNFFAEHHMMSMYERFNQELKERVESLFPNS